MKELFSVSLKIQVFYNSLCVPFLPTEFSAHFMLENITSFVTLCVKKRHWLWWTVLLLLRSFILHFHPFLFQTLFRSETEKTICELCMYIGCRKEKNVMPWTHLFILILNKTTVAFSLFFTTCSTSFRLHMSLLLHFLMQRVELKGEQETKRNQEDFFLVVRRLFLSILCLCEHVYVIAQQPELLPLGNHAFQPNWNN